MKTEPKTDHVAIAWVVAMCALVLGAFAFVNAQGSASITAQMEPGDGGDQVSALQTFLATDSSVYPEGLVTGYYGDLTTAAVERYQCKNGIVCQGDSASTGYGRVGPATLAKIQMQEGAAPEGGASPSPIGYPSTGADVSAPILSQPTVVVSSNSAAIHWTTNESAHNSVMYATVSPFLSFDSFETMPNMPDPVFGSSANVILTDLASNTTYYYVIVSVDASGNIQYGINHSFTTNP